MHVWEKVEHWFTQQVLDPLDTLQDKISATFFVLGVRQEAETFNDHLEFADDLFGATELNAGQVAAVSKALAFQAPLQLVQTQSVFGELGWRCFEERFTGR